MKLLRLLLLASIGVMLAGPIFAAEPQEKAVRTLRNGGEQEELEQYFPSIGSG